VSVFDSYGTWWREILEASGDPRAAGCLVLVLGMLHKNSHNVNTSFVSLCITFHGIS